MATKTQVIGYNNGYKLTLTLTESEVNTAKNTSKVTVKGTVGVNNSTYWANNVNSTNTVTIDGTTYRPTTGYNISSSASTQIFSYSKTVTHSSDGSKTCKVSWTFNGNLGSYNPAGTITANFGLTKIARGATVTSVANFTDEENPVLKYSNPAGTAATSLQACISFDGSTDNIAYRDIPINGTSYTFELTEEERWALRQHAQTSQSVDLQFFVQSVVGGTTFRDYKAATMTIVNADPTFECEYLDVNDASVAVTEDDQIIVQNQSHLQIKVRLAEAYKEAYLTTASVEILGQTYTANFPDNTFHSGAATIDVGVVNTSQDFTPRVVVTDSRGNTNAANPTINVAEWQRPSGVITAQRHNNFYAETDVKVDAIYSSIESKNAIDIRVQSKRSDTEDWGPWTSLQDNVVKVLTFDNNYVWDLKFALEDSFERTTIYASVSRGVSLVFFDEHKASVGINCFPSAERTLETADDIITRGDVAAQGNLDVQGFAHVGADAVIDGSLQVGVDLEVSGPITSQGGEVRGEHILYVNENGTNSNFTLSDSIANYKTIRIEYRNNELARFSSEIEVPTESEKCCLIGDWVGANNGAQWLLRSVLTFNGAEATVARRLTTAIYTSGTITHYQDNRIYVLRVIGLK